MFEVLTLLLQFSLRPVQDVPSQQHPIPIDPALQTPLPRGPYLDLTHPGTIADAKGLKRADKVAGSRRNGKSKERADSVPKKRSRVHRVSSDSDSDEPPSKRGKGGRPAGSTSYGKTELNHMFKVVGDVKPIGQKGWKKVEHKQNKWAKANGYAVRPPKAIENKFKGVRGLFRVSQSRAKLTTCTVLEAQETNGRRRVSAGGEACT